MKSFRIDVNLDLDIYQQELDELFGEGTIVAEESYFEANQSLEVMFDDAGRYLGVRAVTFTGEIQ